MIGGRADAGGPKAIKWAVVTAIRTAIVTAIRTAIRNIDGFESL